MFVRQGRQLIDACYYFLRNARERKEKAARGRSILFQRLAADSLALPVTRWIRDLCPNWTVTRPVRGSERDTAVWQWKVSIRTRTFTVDSMSIDSTENLSSGGEYELVPAESYVW